MMTDDDILKIVAAELSVANNSTSNGSDNGRLEDAMSMYLGLPDGKEVEGRSHVTSTDVADAIEWIMPQVMKSFTQNNEIVVFDPVHNDDERQAELESEYVYEVLMKQNDGFIILHQFVKDALMQRNGILKVYYAEHTEKKTHDWTGITETQLTQLLSAEGVEIVQKTKYVDEVRTIEKKQMIQQQMQQHMQQMKDPQFQQQMAQNPQAKQRMEQQMQQAREEFEKDVCLYNVKVSVEREKGQIYIDPVPPEEFRLASQHSSLCLDNARFTAHVVQKPVFEIIRENKLTKEQAAKLPEGSAVYEREYRFSQMGENVVNDNVNLGDDSQKNADVSECFMLIDVDEVNIPKLMKVTVAGGDSPSLLLSKEEIEEMPWVSTTAFLMSHKFEGLSIYDRLKEIQSQKTTLWRNMFDNMYLQNNQRNVIIEGQVNMDDLLVSRPGGVIRAKRLDAITPLVTPQLGADAYNMMEYMDRVRAGRVGVDPDGSANPLAIGDRVGSQGVDRMMNSKEQLVGLIIRVIAETGVKPLCIKVRNLSVMHINAVVDFRFRGVWQQINPAEWMDRTHTTVRVGTGTGDHNQQVGALTQVLAMQEKIGMLPGQALVNEKKTFDTMDDFCKFSGLNGATRYFLDPDSPEGKANKQSVDAAGKEAKDKEEQNQKQIMGLQNKLADAEVGKTAAQHMAVQAKAQSDKDKNALQLNKQTSDAEMRLMDTQLKEVNMMMDKMAKDTGIDLEKYRIDMQAATELTRIEAQSATEQSDNFEENKDTANG